MLKALLIASLILTVPAKPATTAVNADFVKIAGAAIERQHGVSLFEACPINKDLASKTVFREYGAIFVAKGVTVPSRCIFASEEEVAEFHDSLEADTRVIGGARITLQKPAMDALLAAREEAAKTGLSITARGSTTASSRDFATTLRLWNSRFLPGLEHWKRRGKIAEQDAEKIRNAPVPQQVTQVLTWEQEGIYFARGFSKSILYSVAAPGASQHISMLALDVTQFGDPRVREVLARHGWHRTVLSDLPHFTYLGATEDELPGLGLEKKTAGGQDFWVPKMSDEHLEGSTGSWVLGDGSREIGT